MGEPTMRLLHTRPLTSTTLAPTVLISHVTLTFWDWHQGAVIQWRIPADTPAVLVYRCGKLRLAWSTSGQVG